MRTQMSTNVTPTPTAIQLYSLDLPVNRGCMSVGGIRSTVPGENPAAMEHNRLTYSPFFQFGLLNLHDLLVQPFGWNLKFSSQMIKVNKSQLKSGKRFLFLFFPLSLTSLTVI